ncbi:MAG: Calx-beta domain-containing protein [Actinomycetota bacterium]
MWETRMREGRNGRWRRFAVVVSGGALLLVLGLAPGARATPVDSFSIGDASLTEGDAGTANLTFTISYSGPLNDISVDWSTADDTATAGADYVASSGTASFTAASGTRADDHRTGQRGPARRGQREVLREPREPAPAATAAVSDAQATGRIDDDDPRPSIAIDDPSVAEDDGGAATLTYTVTLSAPSGRTVSVDYATSNGTARQPADYGSTTGTLTFAAGVTTQAVSVDVAGDTLDEGDETVRMNLSGATNATIADTRGVGTIVDDDALPSLSIGDASRTEGNSGTASLTFTVTLTPVSGRTVTVAWATVDGTAAAPADYTSASGTATFSAGRTSRTFTVPVVGDRMDEFDETFAVDLSSATNATITDGQAVGTIVDNDAPPAVSVSDVSVTEGDAGTVTATFLVSLSATSGKPISVDHATADGTAVAGADYAAASGSLDLAPGALSTAVDVAVDGDTMDEFDEDLALVLSDPSNATILDGTGLGTIVDDDLPPSLTVGDIAVPEGDSGTSVAAVPVTLSAVSGKPITVDFSTADGTAGAGSDYTTATGTLSFAPGMLTRSIDVSVSGDTTFEADEDATVAVTNEVNAVVADGTATLTIANDDPLPRIAVDDVAVTEGDSGDAIMTFTVSLSNASAFPVGVDAATLDGTAVQPADYEPVATTLSFAPGIVSATIDVTVHGDPMFERDETLGLELSDETGGAIADEAGVGTITNDDAAPIVDVTGVIVSEGDVGDTTATFILTLTGSTGLPASVDVATSDGTAGAPGDYADTSVTVTFAPGDATETVDVAVHGDTAYELDEGFTLQLSAPNDAAIGTGTAPGTVLNDDPLPTVSITNALVVEGNAGTTDAAFGLSLSNPSAFPVTVDAATADGTALAPGDYAATATTTTFMPGVLVSTFDVPVSGDVLYEGDETFSVTLTNPAGGTLGTATATGTIVDDEAQPAFSIDDVTIDEGDAGPKPATFTVTLSIPSASATSVDVATADGTATGGDYVPAWTSLTLAPGDTAATFTVDVLGDRASERDESFTVGLSNPVGAVLGDDAGIGTIVNDDRAPVPTISVDPLSVGEGDAGMVFAAFTVRLSGPSADDVVSRYLTMDGTATGGDDYAAATGQVTIPPGQTSVTVQVAVFGDATVEPDETFALTLVWASGARVGTDGTATIANDDRLRTQMSISGRGIAGARVAIRGRLVASRAGLGVDVSLYRRVGSRWVEVGVRGVQTMATGRTARAGEIVTLFRTRFRHLEPGRYLARAVFRGDELNAPSHTRDRFPLR